MDSVSDIGIDGDDQTAFADFSAVAAKVTAIKNGLPFSENDLENSARRMLRLTREKAEVHRQLCQQLDRLQERLNAIGI